MSPPARRGLSRHLFAWMLNATNALNVRTYRARKDALFADLSGDVVEIGPGAGVNLAQLPPGVRWTGVEPNAFLHPYLRRRAEEAGIDARITVGTAEDLGLPDESADVVVSTLVLCSVSDVDRALAEVRRVLRPGGRFVFVEHVAAAPGTRLLRVQHAIAPVWAWAGDGCHPDRDTLANIQRAGFAELAAERFEVPAPIIRPHICGVARR